MIQYWIQIPIENARESAERALNLGYTPGYEGYELSYNYETEIISFKIDNNFTYDFHKIYFGEIRLPKDESTLWLTVSDSGSTLDSFNCSAGFKAGKYPYIIWNDIQSLPTNNCYFYGYRFTIDAIPPQFSYLLMEDGDYLLQENGSKFII